MNNKNLQTIKRIVNLQNKMNNKNDLFKKIVYEVNTLIVKNENNYNLIKQFENNLFKVIDKQKQQDLFKEGILISCNII